MSEYTYVAVDTRNGELKATFHRKYELARWTRLVDQDEDDVYGVFYLDFFRVRSYPWKRHSKVDEIPREELIQI